MLEVSNVKVPLEGGLPQGEAVLRQAVAQKLNISESSIATVRILKKSVDARKKSDVHFVMTLAVTLVAESQEMALLYTMNVEDFSQNNTGTRLSMPAFKMRKDSPAKAIIPQEKFSVACVPESLLSQDYRRPVVVGTGPAGLFAALYLAQAGLRPVVVERGACVDERVEAVERFYETGELNTSSNIQFGEGGAGTFSDGKLTTNTKNPLTKTVLEWFVKAGAPQDILVDAKPHMGTDNLRSVVKNMRQMIKAQGGEVRFNCQLVDLEFGEGNALASVTLLNTKTGARETLETGAVILACGHSARDTFALLQEKGLFMQRKAFSVGVRIEHPQALINRAQYGSFAGHPALGAADYKLSCHLPNGRGVYTFCMCPGGQVVAAASEEGGVVVNGMSVHARNGKNANSAVLVGVDPSDFPGEDPLAGVTFQRELEQRAYQLAQKNGGGAYAAPAQRVGDFLGGVAGSKRGKHKKEQGEATEPVAPTYARGVAWSDLHECLPEFVAESLEQALVQFDRRIKGFALPNAVMTAVETRSSSPVRVVRDAESLQARFAAGGMLAAGVYPCGEGAGYAGGIMSAAVDGIRVAMQVANTLSPIDLRAYTHTAGSEQARSKAAGAHATTSGAHDSGESAAHAAHAPAASPSSSSRNAAAGASQNKPSAAITLAVSEEKIYTDAVGTQFAYCQLENGNVRITGCKTATDTVLCPAYLNGMLVSEIAARTFLDIPNLRVLQLPAGVSRLQPGILRRFSHLEQLVLPDALVTLDTALLASLSGVDTLQLPSMLVRIPLGLFRSGSISTLRIGRNTREVASGAFAASTLTRVEIDEHNPWIYTDGQGIYRKSDNALLALATPLAHYSVMPGTTRICHKAFSNMEGVQHVSLPPTVQVIETFAFFRSGLQDFNAPASLQSIERRAFCSCAQLAQVTLNKGLRSIGEEAFMSTGLTQLDIPCTVDYLSNNFCGVPLVVKNAGGEEEAAPESDTGLPAAGARQSDKPESAAGVLVPAIRIAPDNPYYFVDASQGLYRYLPHDTSEPQTQLSFEQLLNGSITEYTLDARTVEIAPYAFARQTKLMVVELSENLQVIGAHAFAGCSQLACVEGSQSLREIHDGAFVGTRVSSLYLPATMQHLGKSALLTREGTSFVPPSMIAHVQVNPLCETFFLENYFLCQHLPSGGVAVLLYCGSDRSVHIPACATEVYSYCLVNVEKLYSVETHDGVEFYETDCFLNAVVAQNVTINIYNAPVQGYTRFVLQYPNNSTGRTALRQSFYTKKTQREIKKPVTTEVLLQRALKLADEAMYWCPNTFRLVSYALERLQYPLFLKKDTRERFEPLISRRLDEIVLLFARNNYLQGIDQLFSLGFITSDNVVGLIDAAESAHNVEVTGHLFELRRRYFGYDVMSEFDL